MQSVSTARHSPPPRHGTRGAADSDVMPVVGGDEGGGNLVEPGGGDPASQEDSAALLAIAESVERGDDPYVVPAELLVEPEPGKPVNQSLYAQILQMTVGERIKLALKGNHDARMILIRDPNRLIQRFVLQNPRISEDEVIMVARNRNLDADLLRKIAEHKQWPRNYQVRVALVTNPKTPLANALHFVNSLTERDIRQLAKSRNVSQTITSQARRLMLQREKK